MYKGIIGLVDKYGRIDGCNYTCVLGNISLPATGSLCLDNWTLQYDNASVHTDRKTEDFSETQYVHGLDCPAKPLDLNIIDNVWGLLARSVYEVGASLMTLSSTRCYNECVENIATGYIKTPWSSIPARSTLVVEQQRRTTCYL